MVLSNVFEISAGRNHVCALASQGVLSCWGDNQNGQLGTGNRNRQTYATTLSHGRAYALAASGEEHTCAVTASADESSWCWGLGTSGQLGSGTSNSNNPTRMRVPTEVPPFAPPVATVQQRIQRLAQQRRSPFHLLGVSVGEPGQGGTTSVHIDPNFEIVNYAGHELQVGTAQRHIPVRSLDLLGTARGQGFLYRRFVVANPNNEGWGANAFAWGTVPTLALAREAMLMASGNTSFFEGVREALDLIDTVAGSKTAILRKKVETRTALDNVCTGQGVIPIADLPSTPIDRPLGVCRATTAVQGGGRTVYELGILTTSEDPIQRIAFGPQVAYALDKALRPGESVMGSSNADLLATTQATLSVAQSAGERELRTTTLTMKSPFSVFQEQMPDGGSRAQNGFLPVFDGALRELGDAKDFLMLDGAIVAYGGSLNALAAKAFEVESTNWSKPRLDAYGIPTDWVPSADPALLGSNGEEPFQYFLRLAKDTAREATKAIEDAFEVTRQEELDAQALAAANEKSERQRQLEAELLCGRAPCPEIEYGYYQVLSDMQRTCVAATPVEEAILCSFQERLRGVASSDVRVPKLVWDQRMATQPSFSQFDGGELQKRLLETWSALRKARTIYETGAATIDLSAANLRAARAEATSAHEVIKVEELAQRLQELSLEAQAGAILTQVREIKGGRDVASKAAEICSDEGLKAAVEAGFTYSGAEGFHYSYNETRSEKQVCYQDPEVDQEVCVTNVTPAGSWNMDSFEYDRKGRSWSAGPLHAWHERCELAKAELKASNTVANEHTLAGLESIAEALQDINAGQTDYDLAAGVKAATARAVAADERAVAAEAALAQAVGTSLTSFQESMDALLAVQQEIDVALQRAGVAEARFELDRSLVTDEVVLRQDLRRRFQGFAQWRAEAMAENARRTAVAARRAIESRFVVDLSRMGNDEPFVAPPAVWADDVYERDLKPPAALGTTRTGPAQSDQLYSNKLLDYVSNLELFVAGYAIERPTSAARNDAELITLPAPFATTQVDSTGDSYALVDPDSMGWRFVCSSGEEVQTSGLMTFGELDSSVLDTLCAGDPPVRASYRFWFDPWGRLAGNAFSEVFDARHNTRWRQLAINLVGTGIRECERAADPAQCYAEPFIRYDLTHVGPATVTSYDLVRHELNIPAAAVEDGKALAIEEWLDPVSRGWSVPEVQAVARRELSGRPLGGVYEVSLKLGPEVRLPRIERIQVLTSVDYWVRQD
jgi:hypothetical protein